MRNVGDFSAFEQALSEENQKLIDGQKQEQRQHIEEMVIQGRAQAYEMLIQCQQLIKEQRQTIDRDGERNLRFVHSHGRQQLEKDLEQQLDLLMSQYCAQWRTQVDYDRWLVQLYEKACAVVGEPSQVDALPADRQRHADWPDGEDLDLSCWGGLRVFGKGGRAVDFTLRRTWDEERPDDVVACLWRADQLPLPFGTVEGQTGRASQR